MFHGGFYRGVIWSCPSLSDFAFFRRSIGLNLPDIKLWVLGDEEMTSYIIVRKVKKQLCVHGFLSVHDPSWIFDVNSSPHLYGVNLWMPIGVCFLCVYVAGKFGFIHVRTL